MLVSISQFTAFIFDFQNGGRIRHLEIFIFSHYLSKIQITVYIYYFDMQNLVKIG